jgi:threonine aldolase
VRAGLVLVENTHNMGGGTVYDRPHLERILDVAHRHGLPVHCDGARIFNAAVALGTPAAVLAAGFDSVMFCLSKGLGAPVGSLLCGSRDFIQEARRVRRMLGGGMRQAGVLAAAGLVALRKGPGRLAEDHEKAARLGRALAEIPGTVIDPASVQTNIVVFQVEPELVGGRVPPEGTAAAFLARLREAGVLGGLADAWRVRLVTHRDVSSERVEEAIERIRAVVGVAVN